MRRGVFSSHSRLHGSSNHLSQRSVSQVTNRGWETLLRLPLCLMLRSGPGSAQGGLSLESGLNLLLYSILFGQRGLRHEELAPLHRAE